MEKMFNLEKLAGGALTEQINTEIDKVINNIYDPNTDAKKTRRVTINMTFKPNSNRTTATVSIEAKSALAPLMPTETSIMIDRDMSTGMVMAAEIRNQIAGQLEMEIEEPASKDANVIDLRGKVESK